MQEYVECPFARTKFILSCLNWQYLNQVIYNLCGMEKYGKVFMTTERLTLRAPNELSIDLLVELDSDPEVMRFLTDGEPRDKKHYDTHFPKLLKYMDENSGLGLWLAFSKSRNEFIGWYILKHLPNDGEMEVGFRIKKQFWGNGYSTEAGKALLKHGFGTLGLKKIAAIVRPDNFASQSVIKKLGLIETGTGIFYGIHCLYFELEQESR